MLKASEKFKFYLKFFIAHDNQYAVTCISVATFTLNKEIFKAEFSMETFFERNSFKMCFFWKSAFLDLLTRIYFQCSFYNSNLHKINSLKNPVNPKAYSLYY